MSNELKVRIKPCIYSSTEWTSGNKVLLKGEIGIESDTGRFKIGDGNSAWKSLEYANKGTWGIDISGTANKTKGSLTVNNKTFNGSANIDVGTIGLGYGGTGATTAKGAEYNVLAGLIENSASMDDNSRIVSAYTYPNTTDGRLFWRKASVLWDYIKKKTDALYATAGHTQSASTISSGTFTGTVYANASAQTNVNTSQIRNISAGTEDLVANGSSLASGTIYIVYE